MNVTNGTENPVPMILASIPDVDIRGQSALKVTKASAGDAVVRASYGKVFGVSIKQTGITVLLKDGVNEVWNCSMNMPAPIVCSDSITLNFSAAGDAYIIFT